MAAVTPSPVYLQVAQPPVATAPVAAAPPAVYQPVAASPYVVRGFDYDDEPVHKRRKTHHHRYSRDHEEVDGGSIADQVMASIAARQRADDERRNREQLQSQVSGLLSEVQQLRSAASAAAGKPDLQAQAASAGGQATTKPKRRSTKGAKAKKEAAEAEKAHLTIMAGNAPLKQKQASAQILNQQYGYNFKVPKAKSKKNQGNEEGKEAALYHKDPPTPISRRESTLDTDGPQLAVGQDWANAPTSTAVSKRRFPMGTFANFNRADYLFPTSSDEREWNESFNIPPSDTWPRNAVALLHNTFWDPPNLSAIGQLPGDNPTFPTASPSWFSPGESTLYGNITFQEAMERNMFTDTRRTVSFTIRSTMVPADGGWGDSTCPSWQAIRNLGYRAVPIWDVGLSFALVDTSGVPVGANQTVVPVIYSCETTVSGNCNFYPVANPALGTEFVVPVQCISGIAIGASPAAIVDPSLPPFNGMPLNYSEQGQNVWKSAFYRQQRLSAAFHTRIIESGIVAKPVAPGNVVFQPMHQLGINPSRATNLLTPIPVVPPQNTIQEYLDPGSRNQLFGTRNYLQVCVFRCFCPYWPQPVPPAQHVEFNDLRVIPQVLNNPTFRTTMRVRFYTISNDDFRLVFSRNPTTAPVVQLAPTARSIEQGDRTVFGEGVGPGPIPGTVPIDVRAEATGPERMEDVVPITDLPDGTSATRSSNTVPVEFRYTHPDWIPAIHSDPERGASKIDGTKSGSGASHWNIRDTNTRITHVHAPSVSINMGHLCDEAGCARQQPRHILHVTRPGTIAPTSATPTAAGIGPYNPGPEISLVDPMPPAPPQAPDIDTAIAQSLAQVSTLVQQLKSARAAQQQQDPSQPSTSGTDTQTPPQAGEEESDDEEVGYETDQG